MGKFILQIPQRCGNQEWATFLSQVSTGQLKTINRWAKVRDAFHVTLAGSSEEAMAFLCADLERAGPFPSIDCGLRPRIDWQWKSIREYKTG
jgi:hypothetical protein